MIDVDAAACSKFQHIASSWLRSGELTRTSHMLSPLEELAGFNYGFVYLLRVDERSCKIGFSEHPVRRIKELRAGYRYGDDLRLMACCVGERTLERELHHRFAHLRIQHERFLLTPPVQEAFARERQRVRERLSGLHLCNPDCRQLVKHLDLRMLHAWLSR